MRRAIRRAKVAVTALVVPMLLASCADGETGGEDGPSQTASSVGDPSDGGPSGTSSDDPLGAPATGPEISTDSVTLNVPEGWEIDKGSSAVIFATSPKGPSILLSVKDFPINTGGEVLPLREVAREEVIAESEAMDPEILPKTEIAGVPVFHLAGTITDDLYLESWGPSVADQSVVIGFEFLRLVRENRRQDLIDEVLASVEWTY